MDNAKPTICYGCMTMQTGDVCPNCGYDRTKPCSPVYLQPGTLLAQKYLVGKVIGHGGFGITYLAYDTVLGIKLAVKEYMVQEYASRSSTGRVQPFSDDSAARFEDGIQRFLDEARILAMFDGNPGIVSVRDFFRANGTAYLVMAYLEGANLRQYLAQNGPMPYSRVRSEILPVLCGALSAVHGAGLLHRDISPDNIFVTSQGQVKIIDFGAARQVAGGAKSMSIILKPGYAPEEQYRSHGKQGPWTDVYAVAATVYRAITGKVPVESLDRLETDSLEPPSKYCADISPAHERVLLRAMSVRAENRYQDMREFHNALLAADTEDGVTVAEAQPAMQNTVRQPIVADDDVRVYVPERIRQGAAGAPPVSPAPQSSSPAPQPAPPQPEPQPEPQSEPRTGGAEKLLSAVYGIIKILLAIAIIAGVLALAYVLLRMLVTNVSGLLPGASSSPAVTATASADPATASPDITSPGASASPDATHTDATASPDVTDPEATPEDPSQPSPTPEETPTPSPGETAAPHYFDLSSVAVFDPSGGTAADTIASAAAFVPPAGKELAYASGEQTGTRFLVSAKPANPAVAMTLCVNFTGSLDQGYIEHLMIYDGSLWSYREHTGQLSLLLPAGASVGMVWSDADGSKEIVALHASVRAAGTTFADCVVVRQTAASSVRYLLYSPGYGFVAAVDDWTEVRVSYWRMLYCVDAESAIPAPENISSVVSNIY